MPVNPDVRIRWTSVATLAFALFCVAGGQAALAAPTSAVQGVVTQVTDGDTLRFTPQGQSAISVRLRDIDAPEICQPWGAEARRALTDLALNKPATLRTAGRDSQGHTVGVLTVDGVNVGQRLVEEGHAWSLRGRNDTGPLVKQERMAKALARGLHAGGGAVMPSEFRRLHGPCAEGAAAAVPLPAAAPPARRQATTSTVVAAADFRCDGRTRCTQMKSCAEAKYFLAHCPGVQMDGDHDGIPCETQRCHA